MKLLYTSLFNLFLASSIFAQIEVISTDSLRAIDTDPEGGSSGGLVGGSTLYNSDSSLVGRKLVFWIHGLAGNEHSWNRIQASTENQTGNPIPDYPERNVEGYALSYKGSENLNIFQLGGHVNNGLMETWRVSIPRRDTLDVRNNFAIAHSQGGIVARAIRYMNLVDSSNYHWQFGALATFGSPHRGAQIINSTQTGGLIQTWIDDGCKKISRGEIQTFVSTRWWLDALISTSTVNSFSTLTCNGLNKMALPILINAIRKPVGADYAVGADNLAKLDSMAYLDTMKVVTFYGVEQEPVLWRTIHSMTYTKDSSIAGNPLSTDPFGLNDDDELPIFVNHKISSYHAKWSSHNSRSNQLWYQITLKSKNEKEKAEIYRNAHDWLAYANLNWKRFIGARKDTTYIDGYHCECLVNLGGTDGYQFTYQHVQNPSDCNDSLAVNCQANPKIVHTVIEEPNDGVVPVSSQIGYPNRFDSYLMENTNHMQERNCDETKARLNQLFNGFYGSTYKLDKK